MFISEKKNDIQLIIIYLKESAVLAKLLFSIKIPHRQFQLLQLMKTATADGQRVVKTHLKYAEIRNVPR